MTTDKLLISCSYPSPCGELLLGAYDDKLCLADWKTNPRHELVKARICKALNTPLRQGTSTILERATLLLDEYFSAKRETFNLELLAIGTAFQREVWEALRNIPYGQTQSYLHLATMLHRPSAVRAVANAVGANPLALFVPCHRIVGSNNNLGGFSGGLAAKTYLLSLEHKP